MLRLLTLAMLVLAAAGCGLLPDIGHEPIVHNPFPQLHRVAVAPFFNLSDEKTVDGMQFANAYYAELQAIPGFDVVPPAVVGEMMLRHQVRLEGAAEARRLAQLLGVDAIVIGAVTDYSPYYPPRIGLKVEWFATNACFHHIPPGYGLPWGTPEEEFIPPPLIFESQFAEARAELASQTPTPPPLPAGMAPPAGEMLLDPTSRPGRLTAHADTLAMTAPTDTDETIGALPAPDDAQLGAELSTPLAPADAAQCTPHSGPVLSQTRIYHGNDADLTEALASYAFFRNDARLGGWKAILRRDDEFLRFCCHLNICEMLSARGGAGESQVVWQWSDSR